MKNVPLPVFLVAVLFFVVGLTGFIAHFGDFFKPNINIYEVFSVQILRLLAVVGGIFLLPAAGWARWLCILWVLGHVVISMFNSLGETMAHVFFLIVVTIVLYLPASTSFFKHKIKRNGYPD